MNKYITNFPKEPHLFMDKDGTAFLQLAEGLVCRVSANDHARLMQLLPDNEIGHDIYVSFVLLKPYLMRYKDMDLEQLRKDKESINRIANGLEKGTWQGVVMEYKDTILQAVKVIVKTGTRNTTYEAPEMIWSRMKLWRFPSKEGFISMDGDFSLTLTRGKTYNEIKRQIRVGIIQAEPYRTMRAGTLRDSRKWLFLPYLNTLYKYVEDNISSLQTSSNALAFAAEILGDGTIYEDFQDIIGRGVKKTAL